LHRRCEQRREEEAGAIKVEAEVEVTCRAEPAKSGALCRTLKLGPMLVEILNHLTTI
jgi:hypothetical protein